MTFGIPIKTNGKRSVSRKQPFGGKKSILQGKLPTLFTWEKGCPDDSKKIHLNFLINVLYKLKKIIWILTFYFTKWNFPHAWINGLFFSIVELKHNHSIYSNWS